MTIGTGDLNLSNYLKTIKLCIDLSENSDEAIVKIQQRFGGTYVYIPSRKYIENRNIIIKNYCKTHSINDACLEFGVSHWTVRRILKD